MPDDIWQQIFRILLLSDEISIDQSIPDGLSDAVALASSCIRLSRIYRDVCNSFHINHAQSSADLETCCGNFKPSAIFPQLIRMACHDGMGLSVDLRPKESTCPHLITSLTRDVLTRLPKIHELSVDHHDVDTDDDLSQTLQARALMKLRSLTVTKPSAQLIEGSLASKNLMDLCLFFNESDAQSSVENENQVVLQLNHALLTGRLKHLWSFSVNTIPGSVCSEMFVRIIVCVPQYGNNGRGTTLATLANDCLSILGTKHLFEVKLQWESITGEHGTEIDDLKSSIIARERAEDRYCVFCTSGDDSFEFPSCFNMMLPDGCIDNNDEIREWTGHHDIYSVCVRLCKEMNPSAYSAHLQYALSLKANDNALFIRAVDWNDWNNECGTVVTAPSSIPLQDRPPPLPLDFWNSETIARPDFFTGYRDVMEPDLPQSAEKFISECSALSL